MSWVTVVWSMTASACLTLALVHGLVWWLRREEALANLLFALMAVATTLMAAGEMWMMQAGTPEQFGMAVRWAHVPVWALIVSLVGFVRLYLRAGRRWLGWAVCGVRTLSLIPNFLTGANLDYREITALRRIPFLGESVSVAEGAPNPWMLVGQLSLLLLVIFVADAALTVWRRGDRRQALVVGGAMAFFVLMGTGQAILVFWGIIVRADHGESVLHGHRRGDGLRIEPRRAPGGGALGRVARKRTAHGSGGERGRPWALGVGHCAR